MSVVITTQEAQPESHTAEPWRIRCRNWLLGNDFGAKYHFLILAAATYFVSSWQNSLAHSLLRTLRQMRVPETEFPLGFALMMNDGWVLYLLPILILLLYFLSSKLHILRKPIVTALLASVLLLLYFFTTYLLVTPFLPWGIELHSS